MPRHVSRWRSGYLNQQANLGEGAPKLPEGRALKILRAADASDAGLGSPAIAAAPIEPRAHALMRSCARCATLPPSIFVPFYVSALACSGLRVSMLSQTAVNELTSVQKHCSTAPGTAPSGTRIFSTIPLGKRTGKRSTPTLSLRSRLCVMFSKPLVHRHL